MANDFISLYGCVLENGRYVPNGQLLRDISPANVAWVMPATVYLENGQPRSTFLIWYVNPQGLTVQTYYLGTNPNVTTIDQFLTALVALSSANLFTKYTSLLTINLYDQVSGAPDILVNDNLTHQRNYNVGTNATDIYVQIKNKLSYTILSVSGDQSLSGDYSYFGA